MLREVYDKFCPNQNLRIKNYSPLFVRSNQWSRLSCYVYDDSIEEVITPSHLLLGRSILTKINNDFNENNMDLDASSGRVHYLQTSIDHYWNRWRQEYLPELCERHKLANVIPDCQIKFNEVVIIEKNHVQR